MYPIAHLINAALDAAPSPDNAQGSWELRPRTNIIEGDLDYRIVMDLPGVRNEDLEISLEGELLTIKAHRKMELSEGYTCRRRELPDSITWQRSFNVSQGIDADRIKAGLEHGVLTVTLPKSEKTLPRRIEVK
jgi:HSP20 family protein